MAMRRRAMAFTIIVVLTLAVIFILVLSKSRMSSGGRQQAIESRIMSMNDFLESFDADAERAIYISSFRALIALEDYVAYRAVFVNDTSYYFKELFVQGYITGEAYNFSIMNESTFNDYQRKVAEVADEVNIDFDSSVQTITLAMYDPWTVRVTVAVYVNLSDHAGLARWTALRVISSDVPIYDLRDPLYSVNTLGKLPVIVKRSNYTLFVNDTGNRNDTTNLQLHLNNSYYINSTLAPNFLMRFENNLAPDVNGIESLVNLQVLADQGVIISDNNRSVVDYLYFGTAGHTTICDIQNMIFTPDNWFILDQAHGEIYQINTTLASNPC